LKLGETQNFTKIHSIITCQFFTEFARLFSHVFPAEEVDDDHLAEQTKQLANRLGVCVVRKGEQDFISDGKQVLACRDDTSMRRCGGQGFVFFF
jgi:NAD(P)H-hydrate repair Nnr-like enzyme with NAD(P)H-hydrate dehydratase domain